MLISKTLATLVSQKLRQWLSPQALVSAIIYVGLTSLSVTGVIQVFTRHEIASAGPLLNQVQSDKDQTYKIGVGLNTKYLKDQFIAVYDDIEPTLKTGDLILLTNENHPLRPTVLLEVDKVTRRGKDQSTGSIFVSREATVCLQIFKKTPGIIKLTMRKVGQQNANAQGKPIQISIPISFNLGKR